MFCSQCGTQNLDTAAFCEHCGRPMQMRQQYQPHPSFSSSQQTSATIQQRKNRGYVIAIVGAVVALAAYYALPFVSYDTEYSPIAETFYNPVSVTADGFSSLTQFSALLTLITLILAMLLIFRNKPFGASKTPFLDQKRRATYAMIGMSMLGILAYIFTIIDVVSPFDFIKVGFWVYLLGMGTVIVGSIMALRKLSSPLSSQIQQKGGQPPTMLPPQSPSRQ